MNPLPFQVFSCSASRYFAEKICASLGCELGKSTYTRFSDGEFGISYDETIRGRYVFIVQSTFPSTDNLMELLLMIDAAKRASAGKIIAVMPYFGWARQDRKDKPRVAIGAKLVADMLHVAGVDRIVTMDLHADQIQGFFDIPVDHLYASTVYVPFIKSLNIEDLVIASPDIGGSKRAHTYAKHLDVPLVLCHKTREKANVVSNMSIIGDVKDKNILIVDDMADTAGTLCKAADLMLASCAVDAYQYRSCEETAFYGIDVIAKSNVVPIVCVESRDFCDRIAADERCSGLDFGCPDSLHRVTHIREYLLEFLMTSCCLCQFLDRRKVEYVS